MAERKGSRVFAAVKNDKLLIEQGLSSEGWSAIPFIGDEDDTVQTNTTDFVSGSSSVQFNKVGVAKTESWFKKSLPHPISIVDYVGGKVTLMFSSDLVSVSELLTVGIAFVSDNDISLQRVLSVEMPLPSVYQAERFTKVEGYLPKDFGNSIDLRKIVAIGVGIKTANDSDVGYFIASEITLESVVSEDVAEFAANDKLNGTLTGATAIIEGYDSYKTKGRVVKRLFVLNNDTDPGFVQVFFQDSVVLGTTPPDIVFPLAASSFINEEIDFDVTRGGLTVAVTTTPTGSTELSPVPRYCVTLGNV
jgi:hypothetical protein